MSLFGSLMGDVEDDPFFGSHMRHMRQMNNMMQSMFADPFGMLGGGHGPLAIGGPRHGGAMMPFMPQMPSMNRLFSGNLGELEGAHVNTGSSYSSSTVIMSNGPGGKPQVISSTSSTKIGPNGLKETKKTHQDSRTGTKKMSIGHHIGERAHVIEREQNVYSGDAEERQEFINIEEDEAEDFDSQFRGQAQRRAALPALTRALCAAPTAYSEEPQDYSREFQSKAGTYGPRARAALPPAPRRSPPRLALPPPATVTSTSSAARHSHRPASRRPIRSSHSPLNDSPNVREVYGGVHPQRHRHRHHKPSHAHAQRSPADQ